MPRTKALSLSLPPTAKFLRDSALLSSWEEEEEKEEGVRSAISIALTPSLPFHSDNSVAMPFVRRRPPLRQTFEDSTRRSRRDSRFAKRKSESADGNGVAGTRNNFKVWFWNYFSITRHYRL